MLSLMTGGTTTRLRYSSDSLVSLTDRVPDISLVGSVVITTGAPESIRSVMVLNGVSPSSG
jgi:hypothetical protein